MKSHLALICDVWIYKEIVAKCNNLFVFVYEIVIFIKSETIVEEYDKKAKRSYEAGNTWKKREKMYIIFS